MGRAKHVPRSPQRPKPPTGYRQPHPNNAHSSLVISHFMKLWKEGVKVSKIAEIMSISRTQCFKWQQNLLRYGSVRYPYQRVLGRPYKTSIADEEALLEAITYEGWMYQDEMRKWLEEERGVKLGKTAMSDLLKRNGWSRKTIELRSMYRSERLRQLYMEEMKDYPMDDMIFLDESIFNEKTGWRCKAYAPIGERARYRGNIDRGNTWSILPAMSIDGYLPCTAIKKGYFDREEFVEWIDHQLLPAIWDTYGRCSKVIVMDNCSVHVSPEIERRIEEAGHLIKYLPPYSPDFNPIELTFSVLKAWIKRHYYHERPQFRGMGPWLRHAINESGCDRFAIKQFRHAAQGRYLFRDEWARLQERLRAYGNGLQQAFEEEEAEEEIIARVVIGGRSDDGRE